MSLQVFGCFDPFRDTPMRFKINMKGIFVDSIFAGEGNVKITWSHS